MYQITGIQKCSKTETTQANAFSVSYVEGEKNKIIKMIFHTDGNAEHRRIWIEHIRALINGQYMDYLRHKLQKIAPDVSSSSSNIIMQSPIVHEMTRVELEGQNLQLYIGRSYINKVISFIRGERPDVVSSKVYISIYNYVIEQCDFGDNSANLYAYLDETISNFIEEDILAKLRPLAADQTKRKQFTETFTRLWPTFKLFVKLIERIFEYLNRYSAEKLKKLHSTEYCIDMFREKVFEQYKEILVLSFMSLAIDLSH